MALTAGQHAGVAVVGDDGVLIKMGRIGCVPGVDFGQQGEGHVRFCFARDRAELTGALEQMKMLFAGARTTAP